MECGALMYGCVLQRFRLPVVPLLAGDTAKVLAALHQRVEDLEDLRELNQAIERQGNKPLVAWAKAKKELGLA